MRRLIKEMFVIGLGAVAVIYLLNPSAGIIELIPDNIPFVGNLDEAGAVLILLNTLRYYGIDPNRLYGERDGRKRHDEDVIYDAQQNEQGEWR
ncbi:MAG: YkvA family protein [Chloroflexota bacterium]